ncbi:vesicle-associated membrane protein 1 isoform X1 [Chionomys nivalis]|uniref:vesicle-associated membrane protein 1 isoform X1 n=1 Tax=Chionomys nivalis TaxID=269649 RepID=UPI0025955E5C|nr:vesicle-associated membrane protein 1 isoform X1 [Chionomys nivalis]
MSAPAQPPAEGTEGAAPGGGPPGPPPNLTSNRRLQQTQAQVEEVVDIMRVNVDKVLERDQKLSELDDRADALQAGASQFESSAAKLKRKYWWKNCKMMIMLGAICAIIVVVIVKMLRVAGREVTTQRATAGTPSLPPSLKVLWPGEGAQWGWQRCAVHCCASMGPRIWSCLLLLLQYLLWNHPPPSEFCIASSPSLTLHALCE